LLFIGCSVVLIPVIRVGRIILIGLELLLQVFDIPILLVVGVIVVQPELRRVVESVVIILIGEAGGVLLLKLTSIVCERPLRTAARTKSPVPCDVDRRHWAHFFLGYSGG
jgi:hypothetical protein